LTAATQKRGLRTWVLRNRWLVLRLVVTYVFTLSVVLLAYNFAYALQGEPATLDAAQVRSGHLPAGVEPGDYVQIRGAPAFGPPERPRVAVAARYETAYYYFELRETAGKLLIQEPQNTPDLRDRGERMWRGKLATVGTVIFPNTTQRALQEAGLPRDSSIPVIEIGDTPGYYRSILPAYSVVVLLWMAAFGWLLWKRNRPLSM
jgi:hypothetical protein